MTASVTTMCRDIDELTSVAQKAIRLFFQECYKAGIAVFVTETYRSQERQNYLYAQGRTRAGSIVTWTTNSRHKSRLAWDICASTLNGNTNIYNTAIIKKAGVIAGKLGITWGGTWVNNLDYPHFEVKSNWTMPKGYSLEGAVSIPTKSNVPIKLVKSVANLPKVPTVVDDSELEEEIKLTKYIPTINDCTSPTLKTSLITKLKAAYAAGRLTSDKWIKSAEDGTLSIVDATLLLNHLGDPTIADISSNTLQDTVIAEITDLTKAGVLSSPKWQAQAQSKTLTVSDTVGLLVHAKRG